MSYTEIYKVKKDGDVVMIDEVRNAHRGAWSVWAILEERHLPTTEITRLFTIPSQENKQKEIWDLAYNEKIPLHERMVLLSTFDNAIVSKQNIPDLLESFRKFDGETSLKEQANIIEETFKNDDDMIGIAWNETSVNGDAWLSPNLTIDENGVEDYPVYNIFRDEGHFEILDCEIV